MRSRNWGIVAAAVMLIVFGGSSAAQAQVVKFKTIKDAVPNKFFDAVTTAPDPANPNRLLIRMNTGFDSTTFIANDFRASALSFSNRIASDTISFVVQAPAGFYIAKITYTQRGTGWTTRGAVEAGSTNWVLADFPSTVGTFTSNPNISKTATFVSKRSSIQVSITTSLFASTGSVAITGADVVVTLAPL